MVSSGKKKKERKESNSENDERIKGTLKYGKLKRGQRFG